MEVTIIPALLTKEMVKAMGSVFRHDIAEGSGEEKAERLRVVYGGVASTQGDV